MRICNLVHRRLNSMFKIALISIYIHAYEHLMIIIQITGEHMYMLNLISLCSKYPESSKNGHLMYVLPRQIRFIDFSGLGATCVCYIYVKIEQLSFDHVR